MSKQNVKATINANIKQNGNQEITGQVLNAVLNTMVDDYGTQEDLDGLRGELNTFKEDVARIAVNVAYKGRIMDLGSSMVDISKKVSLINVLGSSEVYASILPSSMVDSGWLYEYEEGWRLCKVGDFALTSSSTWENLLDWMDVEGHSTKIVGETALNELRKEVAEKADKNGRYPAMSVGSAEALVSRGTPVAEEFYAKIAASSGAAEVKRLKGNTLVWNQLVKNSKLRDGLRDWESWKLFDVMDGFTRFHDVNGAIWLKPIGLEAQASHTYLWSVRVRASVSGESGQLTMFFGTNENVGTAFTDSFATYNILKESNNGGQVGFSVYPNPQSGDMDIAFMTITDLTQMFGAGNEPSTYEDFLKYAPKVADPYAYDEGTIVPFKDASIKTTGRNLWDEEIRAGRYDRESGAFIEDTGYIGNTHPIAVNEGMNYYTNKIVFRLYYDENMHFLNADGTGSLIFVVPQGARYMNIYNDRATFSGQGCCINVSDPSFNGQYEPYISHTLPIDTDFEVEGEKFFPLGLNGIGDVRDEMTQTKAIKRFGIKVFDGTEDWADDWGSYGGIVDIAESILNGANGNNIIMSHYTNIGNASPSMADNSFGRTSGLLFIRDNTHATSLAAWKSHLADLYAQGKPLTVAYELATPVEADVNFNGVFITTKNGLVEVTGEMPLMADIVEAKDYIGIIEDLVARVTYLEQR